MGGAATGRWAIPNRPCSREWFNDGQKAAVRHVLGSRDRVMIIRGVAGTGKTTLEQEIGEALAEAGKPVVAIAQSVKASREVLRAGGGLCRRRHGGDVPEGQEDAGIGQGTASSWSMRRRQLGTRDMLSVFEVAEKSTPASCWSGDRRQHRSVTAGEPLKLLEEKAGLRVAEVTEILRQQGDYKKAAKALSEGRTGDAFEELDKLGWIREVDDKERYQQLADAYLAAAAEKNAKANTRSALVVSPTHAEAGTDHGRPSATGSRRKGKLGKERIVNAWVPTHLTDAQKADATQYEPGYLLQFHQNATGFTEGIAADRGRRQEAPGRAGRPVRGVPAGGACRWRWATASASRPAARPKTASTA